MVWRHAECIKGRKVYGGWIPHIGFPAVAGVAEGELGHELVTKHLCNDRGAGNRIHRLIAANDRRVGPDQVAELTSAAPVDEGKVWRRSPPPGELRDGTRHCAMRSRTWVDALHLSR